MISSFFFNVVVNLVGILFIVFLFYSSYQNKSLDFLGALFAALFGIVLWVFAGPAYFMVILSFYVISSLATRFKYNKKTGMKISQEKRNLDNVVSNGLLPVFSALLGYNFIFLGSLASALSDTLSSEIGSVSNSRPLLITSLEPVLPGKNGAVSNLGLWLSCVGGIVIAFISYIFQITKFSLPFLIWVLSLSGLIGSLFDSYLGATLENDGKLSNGSVNFVSTLLAGLFAFLIRALILG